MSFFNFGRYLCQVQHNAQEMKHPFQIVVANQEGSILFTSSQNQIQAFSTKTGERVGSWIDDIDTTESLKAKVKKEQERQIAENEAKSEGPSQKKRKSNNSEPKVPTPGAGAPPVFNYIRDLKLTSDEKYLAVVTDSDKACVIFEVDYTNTENILKLIKRQPFPKRPSAITTSLSDSEVVLGDKFGDVYTIPIDSAEPKEIKAESDPVLGHVSMLTDITMGLINNQEFVLTADRDEHIRVSHYPNGFIIKKFLFGHSQFISQLCIPKFQPNYLISGGGDSYIISWDWAEGKLLDKFDLLGHIKPYMNELHLAPSKFQNEAGDLQEICVSQIVSLEAIKSIAVLVEAANALLVLKLDESTGKLSLDKIIEFKDRVISFTSTTNKIIASVESETNLLQVVELSSATLIEDPITEKITENSQVEIASKEEIFPLYTTYQLRKRSEH